MFSIDFSQLNWQKASRSNSQGNCVEIAAITGGIAIRDSKNPQQKPLLFTHAEWDAFLDGARNGEFDHFSEQ